MIVVLVELDEDSAEVSREALTFARSLSVAGGGVPIDAVVIGEVTPEQVAELGRYAVRDVHQVTGEAFSAYAAAAWAAAVQSVQQAKGAVVVLAGGTNRGTEVMAHVAARSNVAMAANVVTFNSLAPFTVDRQVMGGAVLEEMLLDERPAVFTVAGHAVEAVPADTPTAPALVGTTPAVAASDLVARVASTQARPPSEGGNLKTARVVVGAGRGAGGPDGFGPAIELAELLGGSLGVSRVVTSLGWRPHHEQVGQTGTRISPDVYVPCGISGAIQHWAGCASSKVILAINTDAEAPMVTKATYAVIGDMHEVLPAVNEELRASR
jgi:electron transfer flavoprotein alpha subunit